MTVRDLVAPDPVWVSPYTSVAEAARLMEDRGCAFMPVVDGGRVVGVVTDRDLALNTAAKGYHPYHTRVSEVMSQPAHTVGADDDPEDAARTMIERNVRRLVVLEGMEFLGVLSVVDLAGLIPDERIARTLHSLAEHNRPREGHRASDTIGGQFLG
jgi:acetoin utilization protein AcuB